ncbi:uncharacterized protein DFL_003252 [Arthrobotrys flagrans]|uniref:Uncharacterized protein n=1 Tax=Arthrobotrys flagrans TaxID=97331 RepID=A0A437A1C2_ARTFL|nr:hypothetical protein DFL_003252 [Arthrobotrys flagrans]
MCNGVVHAQSIAHDLPKHLNLRAERNATSNTILHKKPPSQHLARSYPIYKILACYCTAELVQAVVEGEAASDEEYQAALNRIPQTVRNDNPAYFWRMNGLGRRPWETMSWEPSEMDRMLMNRPRLALDGPGPEPDRGPPLSGPDPN